MKHLVRWLGLPAVWLAIDLMVVGFFLRLFGLPERSLTALIFNLLEKTNFGDQLFWGLMYFTFLGACCTLANSVFWRSYAEVEMRAIGVEECVIPDEPRWWVSIVNFFLYGGGLIAIGLKAG